MRFAGAALVLALLPARQGAAQAATTMYPGMAPLAQYLMPRDAEIALARSAAPASVSRDAAILVLTRSGFQMAIAGTNGFVCLVARSWSADYDAPDFWNPRVRAPNCYNAAAARSQVAETRKRTQVVLAGGSRAEVADSVKAAIESGELPTAEVGAMSYMLSPGAYLSRRDGRWLPHLMFYLSGTAPGAWGAGLPGSPILAFPYPDERLTVFIVPVGRWSDGTPAGSRERGH